MSTVGRRPHPGLHAVNPLVSRVVALVAVLAVAACSGEDSATPNADRGTGSLAETTPSSDSTLPPTTDQPTFTQGVGVSEWLPYRGLSVRVLSYRPGPEPSSSARDRIDQLLVEECAKGAEVTVTHESWAVADGADTTLGHADGKYVNGSPTEDPPMDLAPGTCTKTVLAVGVPAGSKAVYVHDGANTTWVL